MDLLYTIIYLTPPMLIGALILYLLSGNYDKSSSSEPKHSR